ncbi:MAG: alpha/beta hydrolase family protein [Burkholderiaceae bacterium]|jgi:pimeloyl-ACP methyl ester carboxylesterase|nr:alpha/beta hydrolase family protein [Burkholderiaceae bacterium]
MKPFDFNAGETSPRGTVVLLHSSAGSSRQWSALLERLGPRYDVRAVDFYGHGDRPAWYGAQPLTLADDAALVEPILRQAGPVHLVGHSYGGAVALKIAEMHPQSVRSLVVYEPVLFNWLFRHEADTPVAQQAIAMADSMRAQLEHGDAYAAAEQFIGYWAGPSAWLSMTGAKRDSTALRMRSVLAHFGALSGEPLARLRRAGALVPMLCLGGSDTTAATRRIATLLRQAFPLAQHDTMVSLGHMGPITHPAAVNARIAAFLSGLPEEKRLEESLKAT